MQHASDVTEASYRFCGQMSRSAGSSFHAGFVLLPREKRRAMNALYAFMRHTDDLADNPEPAEHRAVALTQWRAALQDALCGEATSREIEPTDEIADEIARAVLPAMVDSVRRFDIPPEHLVAAIDGVEMDLTRQRYETFDELREYCLRVASAVGLACIHIWGFRGEEAMGPAQDCGIAMQLTNILRDMKEDSAEDRVYLPMVDLRQCGYSVDDLKTGVANEAFLDLMQFEIARAKEFYGSGARLMDMLAPDGRRIFGLMMTTYRRLLDKIERSPRDVLTTRVRLGHASKLAIAARWVLLPPRMSALV